MGVSSTMKRNIQLIILLFITFALTACGSEPTKNEGKEDVNNSEQAEAESSSDQEEASEQDQAKFEIIDKVFYTWVDESIGDIKQITTYAAIKNTGKSTIDVSQTNVTYLDDKGEAIAVIAANDMFTNLSPSIISPGEVAYLAIDEDYGDHFSELKDVQIDVYPTVTDYEPIKLEASKVNVVKTSDWGGSVHVTGSLKNNEETEASELEVAAGLYDKENKFIGALLLSSDNETIVPPNGNSNIQLGVPGFPTPEVPKVDHADIQAISWGNQ